MIMLKTLGKRDQFSILDNTVPIINIFIYDFVNNVRQTGSI